MTDTESSCRCRCVSVTVQPEAGTVVEVTERVTLPVVTICIPGLQGPKGDPGKDGSAKIEPIPTYQIDNLF